MALTKLLVVMSERESSPAMNVTLGKLTKGQGLLMSEALLSFRYLEVLAFQCDGSYGLSFLFCLFISLPLKHIDRIM